MLRRIVAGFMAYCLTFGMVVAIAGDSHIVADPTAPGRNQPTVLPTGNGLPQVNIATPNSNGLSYNRYQQFDVGQQGAILNNSNKNVNTQLGGWIDRNPNLAGGMANLIVNEVNSLRPSHIGGFIEIAGQRADVVIANPSGINVAGGGFINANRATLTTGIPVIQGGNLTGYDVRGGQINVLGTGLNARDTTFTDIIAHSVNVNAMVHANQQLNVVTGENFVSRDTSQVTRLNPDAETGISLDVSALGGMYANQIRLVGTGRGVGVNSGIRNEGEIVAGVGEVIISSDGMLSSSGVISGQGGVRIGVDDQIVNTGVMQSGNDFAMESTQSFLNDNGQIIVQRDTSILAQDSVTNTGSMELQGNALIAGIDGVVENSGRINVGGDTEIYADRDILNTGSLESAGALTVVTQSGALDANADSVFLSGGAMYLGAKGDITNAGKIQSNSGGLTLYSSDGTIQNKQNAVIRSSGDAEFVSGLNFINAGTIHSDGVLKITARAGTFGNSGLLSVMGNGTLYSLKDMANVGTIVIDEDLLAVTEANFANEGEVSVGGTFQLEAAKGVMNKGDLLADNIYVQSDTFFNTGLVDSAGEVVFLASTAFTNVDTGSIFGDHIAIESKSIRNGVLPENDTGHAPMTNTVYDPETGQYTYKDGGNQEYEDVSTDFDWVEGSKFDPDVEFGDDAVPDPNDEIYDPWEPDEGEDPDSGDDVVSKETILPDTEDHAYGPDESRGTTTGNAGVIAARDRFDLAFADNLVNNEDGLLLSGGDMYIGGYLDGNYRAAGKGGTLQNSSATIEVGNDLTANLEQLTNLNAHYRTEERLIHSGNYTGYRFSRRGDSTIYIAGIDNIVKGKTKRGAWKIIVPYDEEDFFQYNIHREVWDQFVVESRPGYITTGGNMTITGNILNDRSIIPVGDKLIHTGNMTNIEAREAKVTRDTGDVQWTWVAASGSIKPKHKRKYSYAGVYNPGDVYEWDTKEVMMFGTPEIIESTATAPNGTGGLTLGPKLNLSGLNGNMYTINRNPSAGYVIETNPRFTDYRNWLSSDFMLSRLSSDPENMLKRLGDGYYEQKIVREQIVNKAGARYLGDYKSDEEQYAALMLAGVDFAEEVGLTLGVSLTKEQMARLTTDIVWLEYVTVDTANGPVQALAPVVYLAPGREVLLAAGGGIVSGREVEIKGELSNAGRLLGTKGVSVASNDVNNSGIIAGGYVSLAAVRDINNKGGAIVGQTGVELTAGRDINIESTTYTTSTQNGNQSSSRTELANQATIMVTDENGSLSMKAGNDINLKAANVESEGSLSLAAGNDLNVGGVTVSYEHETGDKGKNYLYDRESVDVGSFIWAGKDMELSAGNDLSIKGSEVIGKGDVNLTAGRDVSITEGRAESAFETTSYEKNKGLLSSSEKKTHERSERDVSLASDIYGNTVKITAGGDVAVHGSGVTAAEGLGISAGGDIDISGADNYSDYAYDEQSKRSGFSASFSGGKFGVSYSKSQKEDQSTSQQHTVSGSFVGSESGDVTLYAGKDVNIAGSEVVAQKGDLSISGENVTITNQFETYDDWERHHYKQSGVSLSLGAGGAVGRMVDDISSTVDMYRKMQNAKTSNAQTLYGIATARGVRDSLKGLDGMNLSRDTAAGISVNLGFNKTESESVSESHSTVVKGSSLYSGGDTTIVARGQSDGLGGVVAGTGDLTVTGSEIVADGKVILGANNDITLQSAEETFSHSSSYDSSSSGFGVGIEYGVGGAKGAQKPGLSVSVNASGSKSEGTEVGGSVSHIETGIYGREGVEFVSGNDTTLKGAQIFGENVKGTVGGNLTIESEQDTVTQHVDNSSSGWGVEIGYGKASGSFNSQKQKGDADYASVDEQSGIFAGSGGFDITVGGNTGLKGAVIDSKADADKNQLTTGTLTVEDIENHSNYDASTSGFGAELVYESGERYRGKEGSKASGAPTMPIKEDGSESSTTKSAVAEGSVVITDEQGQQASTGKTAAETVESLNRDTDNAHAGALIQNPDLNEILAKQAELADASAAAGKAVAETIGEISRNYSDKYELAKANEEYIREALASGKVPEGMKEQFEAIIAYLDDPNSATNYENWKPGGLYSSLLHGAGAALVAQLGGGDAFNSALGGLASQLAAGKVNDFSKSMAENLVGKELSEANPGLRVAVAHLISNMVSSGIGGAVGGEGGANAGSTIDRNDHQNDLGRPEFSDISNVFSNILHLLDKDPALFTNSDLAVFKQFFEANPKFLEDTGADTLNLNINGILGGLNLRNSPMNSGLAISIEQMVKEGLLSGDVMEMGSGMSVWTLPFGYPDAKRLGDLAAMAMASQDYSTINLVLHSQGSRIGLEALEAYSSLMQNSDGPKNINIVFGAPISADASKINEAIGKFREKHPDWNINANVVMHEADGIGVLGRTSGSYQGLNNVGYRDATFSDTKGKHGTANLTGRDAATGQIIYQNQADWIKNFLNKK